MENVKSNMNDINDLINEFIKMKDELLKNGKVEVEVEKVEFFSRFLTHDRIKFSVEKKIRGKMLIHRFTWSDRPIKYIFEVDKYHRHEI